MTFFAFSPYILLITRCFVKHFIFISRFFVAFFATGAYRHKKALPKHKSLLKIIVSLGLLYYRNVEGFGHEIPQVGLLVSEASLL